MAIIILGMGNTALAKEQKVRTQKYKVNTCGIYLDEEIDGKQFDFCSKESFALYDDAVKKNQPNFNNNYILTKISNKEYGRFSYYFVAINPKTKQVFVSPYQVLTNNPKNLNFQFSKNSNVFCMVDTGKNASENTSFESSMINQASTEGDNKVCVELNKHGFDFKRY